MDKFAGMWKLTEYEVREADGEMSHPYGPSAAGVLTYDPAGWMAVQIMRPGIAPFAIDDRWMGAPEEVEAAFRSYLAYFGRFTVDPAARTVTHHVEGSAFPNYIGKNLVRNYEFEGETLVLSTPPMAFGGRSAVGRLVWRRIRG